MRLFASHQVVPVVPHDVEGSVGGQPVVHGGGLSLGEPRVQVTADKRVHQRVREREEPPQRASVNSWDRMDTHAILLVIGPP